MSYHKFCKCGKYVLTTEQLSTDQICDSCKEDQVRDIPSRTKTKEVQGGLNQEHS